MTQKEAFRPRPLDEYSLLGRSGLRVSPLCLGTMTFGTDWGWGCDRETSQALFDRYLDAGGNFIDTADGYTNGRSEEWLGRFIKERSCRDRIVLATKFTSNAEPGNPNAGGNGRKNIMRAIEASLRRLQTEFVDLYWLHSWDGITPVEEVVVTLDALVRSGKVRYFGLSDTPAWYVARAQTLAEMRNLERICALQLEYSLVERNIEREHIPAAQELQIGVCPWSPLAGGFLSGKYRRTESGVTGEGRLDTVAKSSDPRFKIMPVFNRFTEHNWRILDELLVAAGQLERAPGQVAINWVARRPGVTSTIVGATTSEQLGELLASLDFETPVDIDARLEAAGRPELVFPYWLFSSRGQLAVSGGVRVRRAPQQWP